MSAVIPEAIPTIIPAKAPPSLPPAAESYQYPSNIEVWYKMDEGSGTSLTDSSGNNIDGTFGAAGEAPSWVDGPVSGKVLSFDGGDNVALSPSVTSVDQTLEWWLCPAQVAANNVVFDSSIGRRKIAIYAGGGYFQTYDGGYVNYVVTVSAGVWIHVVWSITGGVSSKMYINNVAIDAQGGAIPAVKPIGSTTKLGMAFNTATGAFNGKMGCFRIYSKALGDDDVAGLFAHERASYGV